MRSLEIQWHNCETLGGKKKKFKWIYTREKVTIVKEFNYKSCNNNEEIIEFSNDEMDMIIDFISKCEEVTLSNAVDKFENSLKDEYMEDEYYSKGLGMFVYKNICSSSIKAQATSQLAAILVNKKVLDYNHKERGMEFWVIDRDWRKLLK